MTKSTLKTKPKVGSNLKIKSISQWHQNWVIFKLLARLFFNDWIAVFVVIILPLSLSGLYYGLYKAEVFGELLFPDVFGASTAKIWYEFSMYATGIAGFVYLAVSMADIKRTVLFKKIITGFTTKIRLLSLMFIFYFLLTFGMAVVKIGFLAVYPSFRTIISKQISWPFMIIGVALFVLTSLSLGILFGSFNLPTKGVMPLTLVSLFALLFLAGLWVAPTDIEGLFLTDANKDKLNYVTINSKAEIWRMITFASPFTPSLTIMNVASLDNQFATELKTSLSSIRGDSADNIFSSDILKQRVTPNRPPEVFDDLETFKTEILTEAGVTNWKNYMKEELLRYYEVVKYDELTKRWSFTGKFSEKGIEALNAVNAKIDKFVDLFKKESLTITSEITQKLNDVARYKYTVILKRATVYSNYWTPILVNLAWIIGLNGISALLWKTNKAAVY